MLMMPCLPDGCVNRQLFAYIFAITTLLGDNMPALCLQLILLPISGLKATFISNIAKQLTERQWIIQQYIVRPEDLLEPLGFLWS